jgi:hypothetical protein
MSDSGTQDRIVLDAAIRAGVTPAWTEAVTIVATIASDLDRSAPPILVPTLADIVLLPTGELRLEGGHIDGRGTVAGVGRLLRSLLDDTTTPPELAAIARVAVTGPAGYASLRDFQAALAFFTRPDARTELTAYYQRAAAGVQGVAPQATQDQLAELRRRAVEPTEQDAHDRASASTDAVSGWRRWQLAVAAGLGTIMLGVAGSLALDLWRWLTAPSPPVAATVATRTEEPGAPERGADAPLATGSSDGAPVGRPEVKGRSTLREGGGIASGSPGAATGAEASSADSTAAVEAAPVAPPRPAGTSPPRISLPEVPAPIAGGVDTHGVPLVQAMIYSSADAEVVPPELVRPQLPKERLKGITDEVAGDLELLVFEDGSVKHVQLIPPSNRIQDRMLLSAAKTWRFRPARRAGRPVKYLMRIPITW